MADEPNPDAVKAAKSAVPDLDTQFESLLDTVWREEKYERQMDRIERDLAREEHKPAKKLSRRPQHKCVLPPVDRSNSVHQERASALEHICGECGLKWYYAWNTRAWYPSKITEQDNEEAQGA